MILRGTFLARQRDLDWFFKDGAKRIFPDSWEQFSRLIPAHERHDLVAAYHKRLQSENAEARLLAAHAWARWARVVVTYTLPEEGATADEDFREQQFNEALIQCHYAKNQYFLTCNQILTNVQQLPKVPTTIIHGRRDLTCTLESSWAVHRALPHSRLVILAEAGHLAGEPAMIDGLVTATSDMLNHVS